MEQNHYTEDEANAILRKAVERAPLRDEMSREQLESIASEIGISQEALQRAEQEWRVEKERDEERTAFEKHRRDEFREHLIAYVIVNGILFLMNLFSSPGYLWCLWPILGWGIGLAFSAFGTFMPSQDALEHDFLAWRDRREKRLDKFERRRIRRDS